jgi:bifunctional non-homologous end joining protein LigD
VTEIKLDGFRVIPRKEGERVRLYSRPGNDLTKRFPLIAEAMARLRPQFCIIDGEAVVLGDDGLPSFDRLRYRRRDDGVILVAFDLVELNGDDVRRDPIEKRKAALAKLLSRVAPRIQFNEHIEEDGATVFEHACKLGRVEAQGFALQRRTVAGLAQELEPRIAGCKVRSGRGLGASSVTTSSGSR